MNIDINNIQYWNGLIAKFMGAVEKEYFDARYPKGTLRYSWDPNNSFKWKFPEDLDYHKSWDAIMPVCEKIKIINEENKWGSHQISLLHAILIFDVNVVYSEVIKFIKFYNEQKEN